MHIVSYIIAFLVSWLICSMTYACMEGIFIKTLPIAVIISTVCWLVGEIIYLSITISNKKNKKQKGRFTYVNKSKSFRTNGEGYDDSTAYAALRKIQKEEQRIREIVNALHRVANIAGFKIDNRIILTDIKTGKTYK